MLGPRKGVVSAFLSRDEGLYRWLADGRRAEGETETNVVRQGAQPVIYPAYVSRPPTLPIHSNQNDGRDINYTFSAPRPPGKHARYYYIPSRISLMPFLPWDVDGVAEIDAALAPLRLFPIPMTLPRFLRSSLLLCSVRVNRPVSLPRVMQTFLCFFLASLTASRVNRLHLAYAKNRLKLARLVP